MISMTYDKYTNFGNALAIREDDAHNVLGARGAFAGA